MEGQVWAAAIGEVAGNAFSKVINNKRPSSVADEKLQRLEMLVIKLRGTVEMSERVVGPETASPLLQWRDKLREAAFKGHQVLLGFQQRRRAAAADDHTAAAAADDEATEEEHQGGRRSAAAVSVTRDALLGVARGVVRSAAAALISCGECAVSFTRSTLVGVARGFRSATTVTMLSSGEGVVELNSTVDGLEKTCADMGQFIRLLQVEASQAKQVHRPTATKRKRTPPLKSTRESIENGGVAGQRGDEEWVRLEDALPLEDASPGYELEVVSKAAQIQNALAQISRAVAVAERSGPINVLDWLAPLVDAILEVDRQQERAATINNGNAKAAGKQEGDRRCSGDAVISKKDRPKQPEIDEKLQRLEMLVVKLWSTVEVCGMILDNETTSSAALLQWRGKHREAAAQGHLVLLSFQRRVMGATKEEHHRDIRGKSAGAVYFVRKALHGMERGDHQQQSIESLFDGEVGVRLKSTLDRLEEVCAHDVEDLIKLLQVSASGGKKSAAFQTALENMDTTSQNLILEDTSVSRQEDGIKRRRGRRNVVSSSSEDDCSRSRRTSRRRLLTCVSLSSSSSSSKEEEDIKRRTRRRLLLTGLFSSSSSSSSSSSLFSIPSSDEEEEEEEDDDDDDDGEVGDIAAVKAAMPWAVVRFQAALAAIGRAEVIADGRDLEDLPWLAEWADILRGARERGHAMVVRIGSDSKGEEHQALQLCSDAVHIVENLALDVDCFISLVLLCPSI